MLSKRAVPAEPVAPESVAAQQKGVEARLSAAPAGTTDALYCCDTDEAAVG